MSRPFTQKQARELLIALTALVEIRRVEEEIGRHEESRASVVGTWPLQRAAQIDERIVNLRRSLGYSKAAWAAAESIVKELSRIDNP